MLFNDLNVSKQVREELAGEGSDTVSLPKQSGSVSVSKFPSWKPVLSNKPSKQKIRLVITEELQAALYDKPGISDSKFLAGFVECDSRLDNLSEVTVKIDNERASKDPREWQARLGRFGRLKFHECVELGDEQDTQNKLRFRPPAQKITLARYASVEPPKVLPLRAYYQMKEITSFQVI